jgi:uncharacterized protein
METKDAELIHQLLPENEELQRLVKEHEEFEVKLEEFNKRIYLTEEENRERKRIQKLKLAGRDRIEQILIEYRTKEQAR